MTHLRRERIVTRERAISRVVVAAERLEDLSDDEDDDTERKAVKTLASTELADSDVILSMLFLSPGRHAGEGGDIAEICTQAMSNSPGLNVVTTRLVGENDAILELLATRLQQALAGGPLLMELPATNSKGA